MTPRISPRNADQSTRRTRYCVCPRDASDPGLVSESGDALVSIVDDDERMRFALLNLLGSVGLQARAFPSAVEVLEAAPPDVPSCFVVDIRLPRISGLDLQFLLAEADIHIPIIFLTAHGDIPMVVRAMKAGAADFLTKPFREQEMLDAIAMALEMDRLRRARDEQKKDVAARATTLTHKEQTVLELVTSGLLNKQIAAEMGISEATVKAHRAQVVRKMGARSLAELVRMADRLRHEHQSADGLSPAARRLGY